MGTTKKKRNIILGKVSATADEMKLKDAKVRITMMVDLDVLRAYRTLAEKHGSKYQTLMNQKLKEALIDSAEKADLEGRLAKLEQHVYGPKAS